MPASFILIYGVQEHLVAHVNIKHTFEEKYLPTKTISVEILSLLNISERDHLLMNFGKCRRKVS